MLDIDCIIRDCMACYWTSENMDVYDVYVFEWLYGDNCVDEVYVYACKSVNG